MSKDTPTPTPDKQPFDSEPANKTQIADMVLEAESLVEQLVALSIAMSQYPSKSGSAYSSAVWNLANGHSQAAVDQLKLAFYDAHDGEPSE